MVDEIQGECLRIAIATILCTSDLSWRLKALNLHVSEFFSRFRTLSDNQQKALLQADARELGDAIVRLHLATETDSDVGSEVFALEDFVTLLKSAQDRIRLEAERMNRRLVRKSDDGTSLREKWYQRPLVQAAIATGVFALLGALVTNAFNVAKERNESTFSHTQLNKNSNTEKLRGEVREQRHKFDVFWARVDGAARVAIGMASSPEDQSFAKLIMRLVEQAGPTTTKNMTESETVHP